MNALQLPRGSRASYGEIRLDPMTPMYSSEAKPPPPFVDPASAADPAPGPWNKTAGEPNSCLTGTVQCFYYSWLIEKSQVSTERGACKLKNCSVANAKRAFPIANLSARARRRQQTIPSHSQRYAYFFLVFPRRGFRIKRCRTGFYTTVPFILRTERIGQSDSREF